MAMLAHLAVLVLPVIGPGILWLMKKDQSPFVAYHALQALIFQLAGYVIVSVVVTVLVTVTFGLCFPAFILYFAPAVGGIMWGLKANKGSWEGYPLIAQMGRPDGV